MDDDGFLWNFGYVSHLEKVVLWRIDSNDKIGDIALVSVSPISMPHDFVVTQRHLVIPFPPLHYDAELRETSTFLDSHVWKPDLPTRVLVVNKNDLNSGFWVDLPSQWVFHFSNAWEDIDGVIRFEGSSAARPDVMFGHLRNVMRGIPRDTGESVSFMTQYTIDTKSRNASQTVLLDERINTEFPTINPRLRSLRHEWLHCLAADASTYEQPKHGFLDALLSINCKTGASSSFKYPDAECAEEHLFVSNPLKPSKTTGWILGTTLDWRKECSNLYLFSAENISMGPIAKATINRLMPLGLHGTYVRAV